MPKSEQVALALEQDIREGVLGRGNQLQSEGALMKRFSVSRNTVRRGLEILSRQGLITTRTGIGSFVTYDGETIDSSLGWTVALSHGEATVETRLLGVSRARARGPTPAWAGQAIISASIGSATAKRPRRAFRWSAAVCPGGPAMRRSWTTD